MKDNKIIILYVEDNTKYFAKSFDDKEWQQAKEEIRKINTSDNKLLLWLVNGNLLNITPDGEIYG